MVPQYGPLIRNPDKPSPKGSKYLDKERLAYSKLTNSYMEVQRPQYIGTWTRWHYNTILDYLRNRGGVGKALDKTRPPSRNKATFSGDAGVPKEGRHHLSTGAGLNPEVSDPNWGSLQSPYIYLGYSGGLFSCKENKF